MIRLCTYERERCGYGLHAEKALENSSRTCNNFMKRERERGGGRGDGRGGEGKEKGAGPTAACSATVTPRRAGPTVSGATTWLR
ncbi:hypothetical protein GW17_00035638 [Ensete ventricosum]|nr:hypothetical protein GW17_00035638 [Ensete ventricosum]